MARKINVKLILRLHEAGFSRNGIAKNYNMARDSVSEVLKIADQKGITYAKIQDMDDAEAYKLFFPEKYSVETLYVQPDYAYVHKELTKVGVTLKTLWEEYMDKYHDSSQPALDYRRFCEG